MFHPDGPTFFELIKQALSSTESGYDQLAPKFDHTPFRTPDAILARMAERVGPVDTALDVCCGTGAAMVHFRKLCRDRIVGVDTSRGMLEEAEKKVNAAEGTAAIEFVRADALDLPFRDEFDVVTSVGAFGHILPRDEARFLGSIHRALKPGGRFVFVTAEMPSPIEPSFWMAHGFNAAMLLRNAVYKPEFVMYYLTFTWPAIWRKLERAGLDAKPERGVFAAPYSRAILVTATKGPFSGRDGSVSR